MPGKIPLTKQLLSVLAASGKVTVDFYTMLYDLKYHRGWYVRGGHDLVVAERRLHDERIARQVLAHLRRQGWVEARKIGKRLRVELTDNGKRLVLAQRLRASPKEQAGRRTVVVFDIPEQQRLVRRQLRFLLRQGGFVKLQQSVWVSDHDCYALLNDFITHLKAQRWVNVFRAYDFLHLPNG